MEGRTQQINQVEEKIRLLGQELDQRQGALDKATEHLTRASALRKEAAEAAQRMEEVTRVGRRPRWARPRSRPETCSSVGRAGDRVQARSSRSTGS